MREFEQTQQTLMRNSYKSTTGIKRIYNAFFYSAAGFRAAIKNEDAFRTELILAVILIPLALYTHTTGVGKAMLIGSILLVLIVELLNSAIEAAVDHTSLESNELAKRSKDIASAAVFMTLALAATVWGLVLLV